MLRFAEKVAIVTGSSSGIGRETARQFAKEGAKVTICGRDQKSLQETEDYCLASNGGDKSKIHQVIGNLAEQKSNVEIIKSTVEKWGKIDILVNNAGGANGNTLATAELESDIANYDYAMNLNCRSVLLMCQLAYPHLLKTKGEIVNVSSLAGLNFASPHFPFYGTAKGAQDQLTRNLAAHYIQKGVRVNSVNPGVISTGLLKKQGLSDDLSTKIERNIAKEPRRIPIGRPGTSEEVAKAIMFLADRNQSEFIVGHMLRIDGGSSLHNPFLSEGYTQFAQ